jgi:hypothetical protein
LHVAELDKYCLFVKQVHDGADLATGQPIEAMAQY